ncbi:diacylglycerol kinase-like protein [Thiogranum longum]|uniref:Diacylglycerol kinase-like protein n=1 Tax=Thiogranum longum TaxID=1537524 RepID=A0A4R1HEB7_9GAMM|nr:diacylglycerol kinase family protein [Thiogranum longum]TCK19071.1 diacylglycerol kinase-like protein [Thiogranum longum]
MNPTHTFNDRPRIGLISNPHSRRNRAALADIEAMIAAKGSILHRITPSIEDIPAALKAFAEQDINVVAINGGDGTTAQVLAALLNASPFQKQPAVVLLPGGTTNMNAADAGMHGRLDKQIGKLCRWSDGEALSVEPLTRPVLRIDGAVGQDTLYGMFFGAGSIIINGIEHCTSHIHNVGLTDEIGPGVTLLRAVWGVLRGDPQFTAPINVSQRSDGQDEAEEKQLAILLVTGLERLFLGIHPWWGREQRPLHCTCIEKPAKGLLRKLPGLLRGKPGKDATPVNGYVSHNIRQLELYMDTTFTIDGELYQASREHGPIRVSHGGDIEFLKIGS